MKNLMPEVKAPDARLNDGKFASSFPIGSGDEAFSQFGWTPFIWDIDLGKESSVNAIRLYSDRPEHPMDAILVLGSRDNKQWFRITDLATPEHLVKRDNGRLIYADTSIKSNVRYLKFALITRRLPETWYFDELEINGVSTHFKPSQLTDHAVETAQAAINDALTAVGISQRLQKDFDKVCELAMGNASVQKYLETLKSRIQAVSPVRADVFSTIFPQNQLHREIFAAYAAILRAEGESELAVSNPYRYTFPDPFARVKNDFRKVTFTMLPNERRSELFEIQSAEEKDMLLPSSFEGPSEVLAALELAELPWTDTCEGIPVSTILLPQPLNGNITLIPGLTKRLWLSVNSEKLPPGNYQVTWKLGSRMYPIHIKIGTTRLNTPRLLVGMWDYTDHSPSLGLTDKNISAAISMMEKMRINMPWCSGLPLWKQSDFDKDGNFTGKLASESFDRWLASRPGKPVYAVHVNILGVKTVDGIPCDSPEFYIRTRNWITAWDNHLQELGLKAGQVQWLFVDEITDLDKAAYFMQWARPFREASPSVLRIWSDPLIDFKDSRYAEILEYMDSICPGRDVYYVPADYEALQNLRESGKSMYSYSCNGPSRLFDPFSYYKMHGLGSWHDKTVGIGFWSFGDCGYAKAFNEYLLNWAIYTPVCLDTEKVYSTLALEAIREGAEDNELVKMLEERLPIMPEKQQVQARKLLNDLFSYIEANTQIHIKWYDAEAKVDRRKADAFRAEIIKLLEQD